MNQTHQHRRIGITLIETIMVIALLAAAAVASTVLINGGWAARRNVATTTDDVANALITARNTAITNQATVRVRRLRSGGVEQLVISENAGPYRSDKNWVIELGSDIRLRGTPRELEFMPVGTANRNLAWTVTQADSKGQVTVEPASGQVIRTLP
ncbi:MAG: pilus assembly FimT family protein [Rubripirellula sp.]